MMRYIKREILKGLDVQKIKKTSQSKKNI
ncbi:hypothetical protein Zm00014a_014287 [Zea mays]|uniref:Uncharacterized protein n=1 Tax=Zea mays TaxID=4577 RepID=A0A3L6EV31_MAIZE|nr:hypothetical protein Zm00014a_014287 [Zea mays]